MVEDVSFDAKSTLLGMMVGSILVGIVMLKANQSLTVQMGDMKFLVNTYAEALKP